jgi:hypothetical protein
MGICWPRDRVSLVRRGQRSRVTVGQLTAIAMSASMVHPQPYPMLSHIYGAARGRPKPNRERKKVAAASADAAKIE